MEKHESFDLFNRLFKEIVKTLEVITNDNVYLDEYGFWQWDQRADQGSHRWYEASVELGKEVSWCRYPQYQELPTDNDIVLMFQLPHLFSTSNVHCVFLRWTTLWPKWTCNSVKVRWMSPNWSFFKTQSIGQLIDAAIQFYQDDLVSPDVVVVELVQWRRKWSEVADKSNLPNSASATLRECNPASYFAFFAQYLLLLRSVRGHLAL